MLKQNNYRIDKFDFSAFSEYISFYCEENFSYNNSLLVLNYLNHYIHSLSEKLSLINENAIVKQKFDIAEKLQNLNQIIDPNELFFHLVKTRLNENNNSKFTISTDPLIKSLMEYTNNLKALSLKKESQSSLDLLKLDINSISNLYSLYLDDPK